MTAVLRTPNDQLLGGANVLPPLQQVRGDGMAEGSLAAAGPPFAVRHGKPPFSPLTLHSTGGWMLGSRRRQTRFRHPPPKGETP